ncbi:MAG: tetratricopeptide repeat protein [Pseudomonadota bacterium]|nr:tetratricopeptide repeat protein [Pseudomonadota bacterium]
MSQKKKGASLATGLLFGARAAPAVAAASPAQQLQQALALLRQGQSGRAEALLNTLKNHDDARFDALHLLGLIALQRQHAADALALFEQAAQLRPAPAPLLNNMGIALRELGRPADAIACYDQALALQPGHVEALVNRGNALRDIGQPHEAIASHDRALALQANHPQALHNRAAALRDLGQLQEALASARAATAARADYADAHLLLGLLLQDLKQPADALQAHEHVLRLPAAPPATRAAALNAKGSVLEELQRPADALACYDQALAIVPAQPDALANRASALEALNRLDEAGQAYDAAIAARPGNPGLLANTAQLLARRGQHAQAVQRFDEALALNPAQPYAAGARLHSARHLCDWADHAAQCARIEAGVAAGERVVLPFHLLGLSDDAALQRRCAEVFAADQHPARTPDGALLAVPRPHAPADGRLRIAYLSADLHDHATAHLMADVFEAHDRSRFAVWAYSFGPATGDAMQVRLQGAFEHFIDARTLSDRAVAEHMARAGIDIAIDLKGYTRDARPDILAWRPAPVQVSYLGYPGTLGAPYVDVLLADAMLVPPGGEAPYTERVVRLPGSYQVNNALADGAAPPPTRAGAGLPAEGFVFACFNSAWKIGPPVFDAWMRVLTAVPGSVLWLLQDNVPAAGHLRREAAARGVAPERLVFAPRLPHAEHLARLPLAELFLDSLPYGAHTTASDALRQGVPVLTCTGSSFASRVGASLLTALGLPELITHALPAYEARAVALAREPAQLAALRQRLHEQRHASGLFKPQAFARGLEAALTGLWQARA